MDEEAEYAAAKKYAVRRLGMSSLSEGRLRQAFRQRGISKAIAEKVIEEFVAAGYLHDEEFAQRFIQKEAARGNGPRKIQQKLLVQNFNWESAQFYLDQFYPREQQIESAQILIAKKQVTDSHEIRAVLWKHGFDSDLLDE